MAGFEVAAGDLRAYAGNVDGHAQKLGQAVDAANQAMPDDAYGVICQFLPPLFNDLEQAAGEALKASQAAWRRSRRSCMPRRTVTRARTTRRA